jgi:hypothetical protein
MPTNIANVQAIYRSGGGINVYIIHIKETKEKPISYLLAGKKIFQI